MKKRIVGALSKVHTLLIHITICLQQATDDGEKTTPE
jgi:hypothetical protein